MTLGLLVCAALLLLIVIGGIGVGAGDPPPSLASAEAALNGQRSEQENSVFSDLAPIIQDCHALQSRGDCAK